MTVGRATDDVEGGGHTATQEARGDTAAVPRAPSGRSVPWYVVPLAVFGLSRIVDGLLIWLLARQQVSPDTLPTTRGFAPEETGTSYLHVVANWDGQWYRLIVEHGYPAHLPEVHGVVQQSTWAFYPLFPGLVRLVMLTGASYGLAASVVSLACGAAAMCLLYRMLEGPAGRFVATMAVLALCLYPAAPSFQVAYTESLALLLILGGLWCLRQRRYGALAAVGLLLALTRPIVLPLALVAGVHWVVRWRRRGRDPFPAREAVGLALSGCFLAASFFAWPAYAAIRTGRLDAYFVTQRAWQPQKQGWPSWLALFVAGHKPALMVVVTLAVAALLVVVLRRPAAVWGLELRAWALCYALFLLVATPPLTAVFRYAMLCVVPWWPVPEVGRTVTSVRGRAGLAAVVVLLGVVAQYYWLRWYFVIGPGSISHP